MYFIQLTTSKSLTQFMFPEAAAACSAETVESVINLSWQTKREGCLKIRGFDGRLKWIAL